MKRHQIVVLSLLFIIATTTIITETDDSCASDTYVAGIGSEKYSTLQEAINDSPQGSTITLLQNVNEDVTISVGKTFTLDLKGKTIRGSGNSSVVSILAGSAESYSSITITDSSPTKDGQIINGNGNGISNGKTKLGGGIFIGDYCKLTLEAGHITGNKASTNNASNPGGTDYRGGGIAVGNNAIFVMNGGSIHDNSADFAGGGLCILFNCTVEINGGEISSNLSGGGGGIFIGYYSTLKINDCHIRNNESTARGAGIFNMGGGILSYGGDIEINGGIFENNKNNQIPHPDTQKAYGGGCIYAFADRASPSTFSINNALFKNNQSGLNGGAITLDGNGSNINVSITNTTFESNTTALKGSAIHMIRTGNDYSHGLTVKNIILKGNIDQSPFSIEEYSACKLIIDSVKIEGILNSSFIEVSPIVDQSDTVVLKNINLKGVNNDRPFIAIKCPNNNSTGLITIENMSIKNSSMDSLIQMKTNASHSHVNSTVTCNFENISINDTSFSSGLISYKDMNTSGSNVLSADITYKPSSSIEDEESAFINILSDINPLSIKIEKDTSLNSDLELDDDDSLYVSENCTFTNNKTITGNPTVDGVVNNRITYIIPNHSHNSGNNPATYVYDPTGQPITFEGVVKEGYEFNGWFLDEGLTE